MLKTLAAKHRSRVTPMARKYQAKIDTPRGKRTCFEAIVERAGRKPLVARFGGIPLKRQKKAASSTTARQSRPPPARNWSPGSRRAGANGVSDTRTWRFIKSANSPTSPDRDAHSPRGQSSWPKCAGRRSSSAPPATRPSTRATSPPSRHSRWRATCSETGPRGSDRGPVEKGLAYDRHLATGLPVLLRSWATR